MPRMMRFATILVFALLLVHGNMFSESNNTAAYSVCSLLKNREELRDKEVIVTSTVIADQHSTVLEGKDCGTGIYLIHDWGQAGELWGKLDRALVNKASGLDRRPLTVTLRGLYLEGPIYKGQPLRRFLVKEVLSVEFVERPSDK